MSTGFPPVQEWRRTVNGEEYLISTQTSLVDRDFLNNAFASQDMYWAKEISREQMENMLANSQSLGLYHIVKKENPSGKNIDDKGTNYEQVGYARLITDYITTAYLTDVYMSPHLRGKGLGTWIMACTREILEAMPAMRRGFLLANPGDGKKFYARELGFWDVQEESFHAVLMTKRFFNLDANKEEEEGGEKH